MAQHFQKVEDRLLATHVASNPEFKNACLAGDGTQIIAIVEAEMEKNNLFTKGSKKLREDILRMLRGEAKVSQKCGENILFFVWNSRLSGIGYAVHN